MISGVQVTPLQVFNGDAGNVMHALKSSEKDFSQFGEAYFSTVNTKAIKGWKKHHMMQANLVVPVGQVRFILYDDRPESDTQGMIQQVVIGKDNYHRLRIPPMIWFAFQGMDAPLNLVLNIASIQHDPNECDQLPLNSNKIPFDDWS